MAHESHLARNILIVLILITIVVVVFGVIALQPSPKPSTPTTTVQTIHIVNAQITVNAGKYNGYQFTISGNVSNIYVSGTFTAQGGSGNDIKVYVFDAYNYSVYQNKGFYSYYYYSGQVTNATFNKPLPSSGVYYLVVDNMFSSVSTKTVKIQADVTYNITK